MATVGNRKHGRLMVAKRAFAILLLTLALGGASALRAQAGTHSADKALMWSLIPGGGQAYNHQAWKIPIIYGAFAVVGYFVYDNYQSMSMFKEEYLFRVHNQDQPKLADYASYPTSNIYSLYNSYNRNFQLSIIIGTAVYALNLVDAYVFGHLFDFQIDDNISMECHPTMMPTMMGYAPTMELSLRF